MYSSTDRSLLLWVHGNSWRRLRWVYQMFYQLHLYFESRTDKVQCLERFIWKIIYKSEGDKSRILKSKGDVSIPSPVENYTFRVENFYRLILEKSQSLCVPLRQCMFIVFLLTSSSWVIILSQSRERPGAFSFSVADNKNILQQSVFSKVKTDLHLGWGSLKAKVLHDIWEKGAVCCPAALLFQPNSWLVLPVLGSNIWSCWLGWKGLPYVNCSAPMETFVSSFFLPFLLFLLFSLDLFVFVA